MKHKALIKTIERLLAAKNDRSFTVQLRDGTTARLSSFHQVIQGCSDCLAHVKSYESYIMGNAVSSSSEYAQRALEMLAAVRIPNPKEVE